MFFLLECLNSYLCLELGAAVSPLSHGDSLLTAPLMKLGSLYPSRLKPSEREALIRRLWEAQNHKCLICGKEKGASPNLSDIFAKYGGSKYAMVLSVGIYIDDIVIKPARAE